MEEKQIICANNCGFRVDSGYFERKIQFIPGICPRCNAPVKVVKAWTSEDCENRIEMNPASINYRKVV